MTEAAQNLTDRFDNAYDRFLASLPENTYAMLGKRFCTGFAKFKNRESIELTRIMIMGQSVPLSAAENAK